MRSRHDLPKLGLLAFVALLGIGSAGTTLAAGNLLARYTFADSTTADVPGILKFGAFRGQTYNGVANGTPALSPVVPPGRTGNSLSLDGSSSISALYAGNGGNTVNPFSGTNDYTITSWFRTATTANSSIILSSAQDASSDNHAMAFYVDQSNHPDGRLTHDNFFVSDSNSGALTGLNDGNWHFGAVTYSAFAGAFTFTVDGTTVAGTNAYNPDDTTNLTDTVQIGNSLNTAFPSGGPGFIGNLYDVAIFTGALNSAEIARVKKGDYAAFLFVSPKSVTTLGVVPLLALGILLSLAGMAVTSRRAHRF
jgi:Concanavalin A-like lectin/glucanases superfamily